MMSFLAVSLLSELDVQPDYPWSLQLKMLDRKICKGRRSAYKCLKNLEKRGYVQQGFNCLSNHDEYRLTTKGLMLLGDLRLR